MNSTYSERSATGRRAARFFFWLLLFLALLGLSVFAYTLAYDWQHDEYEFFELLARVLGYVLVLAVDVSTAVALRRYLRSGSPGRGLSVALGCAFATVVLLCAHDVLLFMEYGNELEGTFTMAAFFAMDAALLLLYLALLVLKKAKPGHPSLKVVLVGIILVWALYIVGDMAGYPVSAISDWDEALMKFLLLCSMAPMAVVSKALPAVPR